ncbi:hypothetical protein [Adhaeribacter soli]|uniref:Prepilin-type N-terminal cleavage/methylation domain-containing protein n=1 Tax=Adhaeribacter soli TaxID=2607655 RepID=A0A5N1IGX5_9BACT|nr:hypothetical protein [Adhaeribacter soli]KAA9324905.1 hypothetical protein F0P94_19460 [Adhaeribacter soli]
MNKQVKSFTIVEIMVVLILSGVLFLIISFLLNALNLEFKNYQKKSDQILACSRLSSLMHKDISSSLNISWYLNKLTCLQDSSSVVYEFSDSIIIRTHAFVSDTFFIVPKKILILKQGEESQEDGDYVDNIDNIELECVSEEQLITFSFSKFYTADQLIAKDQK